MELSSRQCYELAEVELLLCCVLHCPRAQRHKALPWFLKGRQAPKRLASSTLGRLETRRCPQCSYSLPATSLTKACETQLLPSPGLAQVELLLIPVLHCPRATRHKSLPWILNGRQAPKRLTSSSVDAKEQLALRSALLSYRQHLLQRPVKRSCSQP